MPGDERRGIHANGARTMKDDAPMPTPNELHALDAWARHASRSNGFGGHDHDGHPRSHTMQMQAEPIRTTARYARTIEVSKRIRWDIDRDVIRGRAFDYAKKFLPDGLSFADRLAFLSADEKRFFSQVQGRTYANLFGLTERFIGAKMLDVSRSHALGDQVALEALVRFTDEELKHQELFRRLETMMAGGMPEGYRVVAEPDAVASDVLSKSTWAVLGLTCLIELFTQAHYRASIEPDPTLSPLFKDVFLHHWKEESQHAILDELEWVREDAKLSPSERDRAVDDLIALAGAVDGLVQGQAAADTSYFLDNLGRTLTPQEGERIGATLLAAYRWQYIGSGVGEPRFVAILSSLTTPEHKARIGAALAPIVG
jgi:hypothetical protein